ncbi:MAG: SufE family protein [Bdellovibrionales bacterium]|jgi:cysteine desulfuration protein SufE|nr:SufE family protein [Bdellovibrionales bacterium]
MNSNIEIRVKELISEFNQFKDWEDRYKYLIQLGKNLSPLPEDYRIDKNLIKGCQSKAWLHAEFKDGIVNFHGDSEAAIVKGIMAIALKVYSGSSPDEILKTGPGFLEEIGLREHLSMSRSNGLSSLLKLISTYAIVFKNMESK